MSFSKITDHAERALNRLALQFFEATRLRYIVQAIGDEVQELENGLWDLQTVRDVDDAPGAVLDKIGELVGAPVRGPKDDYLYGLRIKAQLLLNRGSGDFATIYDIAEAIVPAWATAGAKITEYVGAFEISSNPGNTLSEPYDQVRELAAVLNDAAAGGVRAIVMHRDPSIGGGNAFRFAGGSGASAGFGIGKFRAAYDQ